MRKFSADERFVAGELARTDLYYFSRWMFLQRRRFKWMHSPHHKIICDALMRVYSGETTRLIINVPPRYSKTELAVVNFIAWALGQVPDAEFIHTSYSATLAANNSAAVLGMLQHEAYQEIFPGSTASTEAKAHWSTTAGGVMYAAGTGGTITGFGAGKNRPGFSGAIVIDDPHKPDEATSPVIRKGVIDWFQNTLESRKNSPQTPIILIMQRLHEEDLAGWLLAGGNGEKWDHVCLPALREDGTALWPEKHTVADLERMQKAAPYVFAGQSQQRPSPATGGLFETEQMETIDALPAGYIQWVRGWDLASTTDGDWTAGVRIGRLNDGRFVIADVERLREGPHKRDTAIKNTASADGKATIVGLPQDPGAAGKTQVFYLTQQLAGYRVKSSPESGDKVIRAEPLAAQINIGNVLILRGEWNKVFKDELAMFPNGKYDDQVDGASRAFGELIGKAPMVISDEALAAA